MSKESFQTLTNWFLEYKRDFPWREDRTFYRVWVSEVMLQQTRAEVVVPYFNKWMEQFPDITSLAEAPLEKVIKCWEGLGYYSRARNLHTGAKQIKELGAFPKTSEALKQIKGLGPYTVGAILSFAYKKRALAIDGNVLRVLSRFFLIDKPIDKTKTKNLIADLLEKHLPHNRSWITSEALIELGAVVCKKVPDCGVCPIQKKCLAKQRKVQNTLPIKEKKTSYIQEKRIAMIIQCEEHFLLRKNEEKVMKDLYEFPYFQSDEERVDKASCWIDSLIGEKTTFIKTFPKILHTYTKYRIELFPFFFLLEKKKEIPSYTWVYKDDLNKIPFSSGHKKIKERLF